MKNTAKHQYNPGFIFFVLGWAVIMLNTVTAFAQDEKATDEVQKVYSTVDVLPSFHGGTEQLVAYLSKAIKYPSDARKANTQGKVMTSFIVETDGTLSNCRVISGIGSGCDEVALKAVRDMPSWTPGQLNGQSVRTEMVLPIQFKL